MFDGKYAIVTGSTQGLGAEIAKLLASQGMAGLAICGRSADKGGEVARRIERETSSRVTFVQADLGDIDDCRKVVSSADYAFGKVDFLVNAAALTDRGTILDTDPALFDRLYAVNVRAPFFLMQDVIKLMRRDATEGAIVNISSMSSHAGQPFIAAYSATKAALDTLTRNTAYAVLRNRIRVNGLNIGWMASEGEDRIQRVYNKRSDGWLGEAAARQPFGRLIGTAEVARVVSFLLSSDSGLMTGSTIHYDQTVLGAFDKAPSPSGPL